MRAAIVRIAWWLLLATCTVSPLSAGAQSPGAAELRVTVQDPSGAALATARVRITDTRNVVQEASVSIEGVATVKRLAAGPARLLVEAQGFAPFDGPLTLEPGVNTVSVELPLAGLEEEIVVREEADRSGNSFVTVLTEREIADLPDDPDELERMLMEMAGPDAVMRVNGFRGGRLPPKSQIRQIRFRRNSYAAENHDAGGVGIDIVTRPGLEGWSGTSSFAFRDESLNATNAFAERTGPEQYRRFNLAVDGPLVPGRTSLSLVSDGNLSYGSETVVAALPDGLRVEQVRRPTDVLNATARVHHAFSESQTLQLEYQRERDERRNLGVGDFDLPSRAYAQDESEHRVRAALNGAIGRNMAHELKVQFSSDRQTLSSSARDAAVIVVDAFSSGGAGRESDQRVRELDIEDHIDVSFGRRHAVRAGVLFEGAWYRETELTNGNGTFTFSSLESFNEGRPNSYTRRTGGTSVEFAQSRLGVYVQDDVTFNRQLSVSIGVRQELQNTVSDRLNLAPRVGFTWAPGKWTVRGGWGLFNEWYASSLHQQTLLVNGVNQQELVVLQPGYPDPFAGGDAVALPPGIIRSARDLRMAYVRQASIGVERTFGSLRVQGSYVAQRGYDQARSRNQNPRLADGLRQDPQFGNITEIESSGREQVDRLHAGVGFARPEQRLFVNANYTLSRSLNHTDSALQLPADNDRPDAEWGPSSRDARHRLFVMANIGLPRRFRVFLMSLSTSALPYTVITGLDTNGDGVTNDRPEGVGRNTARGAASWNLNARLAKTFSFGPPRSPGGPGPEPIRLRGGPPGRGGRRGGPGGDVVMAAADPDAGRYRFEVYVQANNVLNRTNYTRFSGSLRSPFFGRPTAAGPARSLELGLMFGF